LCSQAICCPTRINESADDSDRPGVRQAKYRLQNNRLFVTALSGPLHWEPHSSEQPGRQWSLQATRSLCPAETAQWSGLKIPVSGRGQRLARRSHAT